MGKRGQTRSMALPKPYYDHDGITIYHGDCRELLPHLPQVDLVLTDPPYGVTACEWDKVVDWMTLSLLVSQVVVCFAINPYASALVSTHLSEFRHDWVWVKNTASGMMTAGKRPMRRHENILVFGNCPVFNEQKVTGSETSQNHFVKGYSYSNKASKLYDVDGGVPFVWSATVSPHSVLPCDSVGNRDLERVHPTQKPVALLVYLVKTYSNVSQIVLDPFMGSGTTLRAAKDLRRKAIGIEIEEKYCEIAVKRMEQEVFNFA